MSSEGVSVMHRLLLAAVIALAGCTSRTPPAHEAPTAGAVVLARTLADKLGPDVRVVRVMDTGSMEPTLGSGSLLLVAPEPSPCVGDILVFRIGDGLIVHRVREVLPDGRLWTKGDNNARRDAFYVLPSEVQGRVLCILDFTRPWTTSNAPAATSDAPESIGGKRAGRGGAGPAR